MGTEVQALWLGGPCVGGDADGETDGTLTAGRGGAGNATPGGFGGSITSRYLGGAGGAAFENPDLIPLRGGCATWDGYGTQGAGAIQVVSRVRIEIAEDSVISANGKRGGAVGEQDRGWAGGGSSGGGVLLEAPDVVLGAGSALVANGGGGGAGIGDDGSSGEVSTSRAPGGRCNPPSNFCSNGGDGGAAAGRPSSGMDLAAASWGHAGGGGGAAGYIRINTSDRTYTRGPSVVESPTPTTGRLSPRIVD
jgi:hypothetical protein